MDLLPLVLSASGSRRLRVYLLGGAPGVADRAAAHLRGCYSNVEVVGAEHGYFRRAEEAEVAERVRRALPDLLLVGLGNPRQEQFIGRNLPALGCRVAVGVGGLFDHWAGSLRRAAPWMRRWGLEWLQLLIQQPHKWRRYLLGNSKFLWRALRPAAAQMAAGAITVALSAALSLAAGEAAVRLARPQILGRYPEGLYLPSASRQYRLRPGFRGVFRYPEFETEVRINAQGLRAERDYGPPRPGVRRVLAAGDSFTMGYSVAEERTWIRVLEGMLGPQWEVINAGTPGYSTWQEAAYLEEEGIGLRPEIILLGFFLGNDIADNAQPCLPVKLVDGNLISTQVQTGVVPLAVKLGLARHSHLYQLAWRVRRVRPPAEDAAEDGWRNTAGLIDRISRLCRGKGIRPIVVLMPDRGLETRNRRMRAVCERARVEWADLTDRLRGSGLYFPQDGHWTERGNALAAAGIYEYLVGR